jgi:hypothetical protein
LSYVAASDDRRPAELEEPPAKQPLPPAPSPVEMTVRVKKPAPLSDSLDPGPPVRTAAGTADGGAAGMASPAPVAEVSHVEPAERAEVKTKQDLPPEPAQMATLPQLRLDGQKVVLPPTEPAEQPAGKPVLVDSPVEAPAPGAERHWLPEPVELLARLARLNTIPELAPWARQVQAAIDELVALESPDAPRAAELLQQLDRLAAQPDDALPTKLSPNSVAELAHARNALARRIDIWQRVPRVSKTIEVVSMSPEKGDRLGRCLDEIDAETSKEVTGSHWREYLLIDALRQLRDRRSQLSDDQRRLLARRVLGRLERSGLSNGQRQFLRTSPLASLRKELYQLSAEPIDSQAMLTDLEEFERQQLPSQARLVAHHWHRLRWSAGEGEHELARFVDGHYRNANIRVSISSDLLSKVLPPQSPRTLRVDETILGYPTYGWSTTETKLGVRLIPDPHHLRLAIHLPKPIPTAARSSSIRRPTRRSRPRRNSSCRRRASMLAPPRSKPTVCRSSAGFVAASTSCPSFARSFMMRPERGTTKRR